jgi:hypothetical protein
MDFTEIKNGADAHTYFSSHCFNLAWDLIDIPQRTDQQNTQMLAAAYTSLWHWQQREDCNNQNLSVAYWQLSSIHALLGQPDLARQNGHYCVEYAREEGPFYLGYGYEALARAEKLAKNEDLMFRYKNEAARLSEDIKEKEDREALLNDLKTV